MRSFFLGCLLVGVITGCRDTEKTLSAQDLVDRAIEVAGGDLYEQSEFKFKFRDMEYVLERENGKKIMKRIKQTDSGRLSDIRKGDDFMRFLDEQPIQVSDSMASVYSNSINSVHYFAYLPYGLNDAAVNKELLGTKTIGNVEYYKVKVTFDQQGGGEDFEDVYLYWIDKEAFKPVYLAYEFHVDGGGMRFREAYNERYVNGIRIVDYLNFKPKGAADIMEIDDLFEKDQLELLSEIKLEAVEVSRDNYN
ncbi:MAG: deoxyribose-phosphate aldolase [Flavobacteriaceae bacterium]|nr:deoxyribose-phosphate aldolase [Flavobacteriaceae bacterium]